MRITARSLTPRRVGVLACAFVCALSAANHPTQAADKAAQAADKHDTPYTQTAKLAAFLSDGEAVGALESFDRNMTGYAAIAEDIAALAAQTEVLCSIDVVEDKEAGQKTEIHHLDLDWYMMLKSRTDSALVERRRQRVSVTFELMPAKAGRGGTKVWRITQFSPASVLAPLTVR